MWANVRIVTVLAAIVPMLARFVAGTMRWRRISLGPIISQKKKAREQGKDKHSSLYIIGLDHEIDALTLMMSYTGMIKCNAPSMSDEMITKMYCSG